MTRDCKCGCGESFEPTRPDRVYKSKSHAQQGWRNGHREYSRKRSRDRYALVKSTKRGPVSRECAHCGAEFPSVSTRNVYCAPLCRRAANAARALELSPITPEELAEEKAYQAGCLRRIAEAHEAKSRERATA